MLKITVDAKATYDVNITSHDDNMTVKGTLRAQGGFGIKAELSAEFKAKVMWWEAYAGAGAIGELMSDKGQGETSGLFGSVSPVVYDNGKGFDWSGQVGFNGLAFYYAVYAYAGVRSAGSEDKDKEGGRGNVTETSDSKIDIKQKADIKGKVTLVKPWVYPEVG